MRIKSTEPQPTPTTTYNQTLWHINKHDTHTHAHLQNIQRTIIIWDLQSTRASDFGKGNWKKSEQRYRQQL